MRHITFTCDRCGKEIYRKEGEVPHLTLTNAYYAVRLENGTFLNSAPTEYDLCSECLTEIIVDLNKHKAETDEKLARKIEEALKEVQRRQKEKEEK